MADVMDTAAAVAWLRALEELLPAADRLFDDPLAQLFARGPEECEATALMLAAPFVRESIRLRTRYIDDALRDGLQSGLRQLLILGSGFDCRGLRMPEIAAHQALVFEVDFAVQLARKQQILTSAAVAIPRYLHMVECDFTRTDYPERLIPELVRDGFATGAGAIVVLEGVLSYLDPPDVERVLDVAATAGGAHTRLVFNYPLWRFSTEAMAAHLRRSGFEFLDDRDSTQMFRQYVRGEPPAGGDLYHLATAVLA